MEHFAKMHKRAAAFVIGLALATPLTLVGQEGDRLLPDGLGIGNQMKYSYDWKTKLEIFEDWLNLDYRYRIFSAGLRFDVFQPNDMTIPSSLGKARYADVAFKYIGVDFGAPEEGGELTVGNYYVLFGRGLILKSYEDRNIRVDNNLLGVSIVGRYHGLTLKALTGSPETFSAERKDILHAIDLEYRLIPELRVGGSFASNKPAVDNAARTRLASVRILPAFWNFDFYGEYGIKQNDDIRKNAFGGKDGIAGRAIYGSGSFFYESFSISGEYKLYDNFAFLTSDQTVAYNTPPALRRDYSYILLNRHPSPLNPDNERGFQLEANFDPNEATSFVASYGVTKTLASDSYFQRTLGTSNPVRTQLREAYGQATRYWVENFATTFALGYNEELSTDTKSITPILETRYTFSGVNTVRLILEHQQVTNFNTDEQYYDDAVTMEFLRSPSLSLSLVAEMQTHEPHQGMIDRQFWGFGQIGYTIGNHTDISILLGSRQAGNICIGGVCRYEPEFKGIELRALSRF